MLRLPGAATAAILAAALSVGVAAPAALSAQGPPAPFVRVTPGNKVVSAGMTIPITVEYCSVVGNAHIQESRSMKVYYAGQMTDYTAEFGYVYGYPPADCAETNGLIYERYDGAITVSNWGTYMFVARIDLSYGGGMSWETYYTVPRPPRGVTVTSEAQYVTATSGSARTHRFTITNSGEGVDTVSYAVSCTAPATGCSPLSGGPVPLAAGASTNVTVSYVASGAAGAEGVVSLTASLVSDGSVSDGRSAYVMIRAAAVAGVVLPNASDSGTVERGRCLTVAVGDGAAYECGDVRLAHALPAVRTFGKVWAPTLLYNSHHARPRVPLTADVTLPAGALPATVAATISVAGGTLAQSWAGSDWGAGGNTRRVATLWNAWGNTSCICSFTMDIRTIAGGVSTLLQTVEGKVTVIDRSASYFGAGWWLAGHETISSPSWPAVMTWVGGDGSSKLYTYQGYVVDRYVWLGPRVDRPDTLTMVQEGGTYYYYRHLAGGGRVKFNASGQHIQTIDRLGRATGFTYDGGGRVATVTVPTPSGTPLTYTFTYTAGYLTSVAAPGPGGTTRTVTVARVSGDASRIQSITDPDGSAVTFGYHPSVAPLVLTRTDRRGYVTTFMYDAAFRMDGASLANGSQTIVTAFRPAEVMGTAEGSHPNAQPLDSVYTRVNGPRTDVTDVTKFWPNKFGAPTRIQDALGRETKITYDATWPALAAEVRDPSRALTRAFYNARGLLDSTTVYNPNGDGLNATTRYTWDGKWRSATRIVSPTSDTTTLFYDNATGNRLWQQPGSDATRRITFAYHASASFAGMLQSVTTPGVGTESVAYDAARGNVYKTTSPMGVLSFAFTDAIGRDTLSVSPIDAADAADSAGIRLRGARVRTAYNAAGRVDWTETWGPDRTAVYGTVLKDSVRVTYTYDLEGNVTQTARRYNNAARTQSPTIYTYSSYDGAGRMVTYHSPSMTASETYTYDPAGNQTQVLTSRGHTLTMTYDAAGQLVRRAVPQVDYQWSNCLTYQYWQCWFTFPTVSTAGSLLGSTSGSGTGAGVCIPADTARFAYDANGRMTRADNGAARIRRSYVPSGALSSETLRIRTYYASWDHPCAGPEPVLEGPNALTDFDQHVYTTSKRYDLSGRLVGITHPSSIAPAGAVEQLYTYRPQSGELTSVRDVLGNTATFVHDLAGRRTNTIYPGLASDNLSIDADGRVTSRLAAGNGGTIVSDDVNYDAMGRVTTGNIRMGPGGQRIIELMYGPLGAVVTSEGLTEGLGGGTQEQLKVDGLGNRAWKKTYNLYPNDPWGDRDGERYFDYVDERLLNVTWPNAPAGNFYLLENFYDAAGNLGSTYESTIKGSTGTSSNDASVYYYGADQKLRATNRHVGRFAVGDKGSVFEEYRYDALGRRVLTRTRQTGSPALCSSPCVSTVTRTVWDGDQLLYEIRAPGDSASGYWGMENDSPSGGGLGDPFGKVAYTHAGGIDAPVAVIRMGSSSGYSVSIAPIANWRGEFVDGVLMADGRTQSSCEGLGGCPVIDWPGAYLSVDKIDTRGGAGGGSGIWMGSLVTETGDGSSLKYLRNRYYDPKTGRFTQEDPIGLAGGVNSYGFAGGDPVNFSDPFGLCPQCLVSVAQGWALAKLTGQGYSWEDAARDAALGAIGIGAAAGAAKLAGYAHKAYRARKAMATAKATAAAAADAAQAAGKTKGAAAALTIGDETLTATSGARSSLNPQVQKWLDEVPPDKRSAFHGKCAEIGCLSDALDAGLDTQGGAMSASKVRKPGHPDHATPLPACSTCREVAKKAGTATDP